MCCRKELHDMGRRSLVFLLASAVLICLVSGCTAPQPRPSDEIYFRKFLPEKIKPSGILGGGVRIGPEELFRGMDESQAQSLFSYNLKEAFNFNYQDEEYGDILITVEAYVTSTILEAFGMQSRLRPEGALVADIGAGGFSSGPQISFYKGTYAVRLFSQEPVLAGSESMMALAEEIARRLPGVDQPPRELTLLVGLGLEPDDISYEGYRLLGSGPLAPGLTARLPGPSYSPAMVFISPKASLSEATTAFQEYISVKSSGPKGISFALGVGDVACRLWDEEYGWINLAREGPYVMGVAGLGGPDRGWPIISQIVSSLGE